MSTKAHIETDLSLKGRSIPIDDDTVELFHYDISPNGVRGTRPMGAYVDDDTLLYYDMGDIIEKPSGTYVMDKSPKGNYGKVHGASPAVGRIGQALSFDGLDDYISIREIHMANDTTISMWLYWAGEGLEMPFGKEDIDNYFGLQNTSFMIQDSSNTNISWAVTPTKNKWMHLCLTRYENLWELFVDGLSLGTMAVAGELYIDMIGNGYTGSTYSFTGMIDKVLAYSRAFSQEDVISHFMEGVYTIGGSGKYLNCVSIESAIEGAKGEGRLYYTDQLINPMEFTISMWVRGDGIALSLNDQYGMHIFRVMVDGLEWTEGSLTAVVPTIEWNMVSITYDQAAGWKLYSNGKLAGEEASPYVLTVPEGSHISLGCYGDIASNVSIDELRIDKIARTDEEIEQWYISQAPFFPLGNERIVL